MGKSEILASIPSTLGNIFNKIYLINTSSYEYYNINYTGEEIKVSSANNIDKLKEEYKDIVDEILTKEEIQKVINNLFICTKKENEFILVFITDIKESSKVVEDKKMLLIADDSPIITKFFTKTFEDEYEILVAANGEEAIKLIEENKDNNLLGAFIDLQMPIKNGYEVLEYFKENDLYKDIPVSVISGEDSQEGINKATAYGIVDMLQKPFNAEAARSIVNKTISFSPKNK